MNGSVAVREKLVERTLIVSVLVQANASAQRFDGNQDHGDCLFPSASELEAKTCIVPLGLDPTLSIRGPFGNCCPQHLKNALNNPGLRKRAQSFEEVSSVESLLHFQD